MSRDARIRLKLTVRIFVCFIALFGITTWIILFVQQLIEALSIDAGRLEVASVERRHLQCANRLAAQSRSLFAEILHTDYRIAVVQVIYVFTIIVLGSGAISQGCAGGGRSTR